MIFSHSFSLSFNKLSLNDDEHSFPEFISQNPLCGALYFVRYFRFAKLLVSDLIL